MEDFHETEFVSECADSGRQRRRCCWPGVATTTTLQAATPQITAAATTQASPEPQASTTSTLPPATRIVSLSPTATEMLFAIGADGPLVAVDDQSNYPPQVLDKPHDLSGYQPNVEAIAAIKPDLVLIGDDSSGLSKQLQGLGLTTWVGPAASSFDDVYTQIEQLGALTGHIGEAAQLVSQMQTEISAAVAAAPKPSKPMTYYHELDNTYYSVTENTFIGQVYARSVCRASPTRRRFPATIRNCRRSRSSPPIRTSSFWLTVVSVNLRPQSPLVPAGRT